MRNLLASMAVLLTSVAARAAGQAPEHAGDPGGTVDFPVSCSAEAQAEFNRGVALLHHMTYPQARQAFERVASIDRRCAMAHWGIAMTLFQPLWPTRPRPEELRRGWAAVQTARSLAPITERERLFIDAAAAFFRDPESTDYWLRMRRWRDASERLHGAFGHDAEATAFHALALLAVAPSDSAASGLSERASTLLLGVYERNPNHPGAMHYLVHANDAAGRERESPEIVRRYARAAPRNPHALHMPTHIYTRLGDWEAVIDGNLRAADAALEHRAGDRGQYVWDEFPHALEYLIYAYLQQGADERAATQLERLRTTRDLEPTFKTAFHIASTRARFALERRAWSEAVALVPRDPPALAWDRFTWAEAVTWFARGLGAARLGSIADAVAAAKRLDVLEAAAAGTGENLFARNIHIQGLALRAWLAQAERDTAGSVALMREAAELEVATPKHAVTPAPTLPGYELLGDLLLEQGRAADALVAYERSLELYPRRFNSLLGAARAARRAGDAPVARRFYQTLLEVAGAGTRRADLDEARAFVSGKR